MTELLHGPLFALSLGAFLLGVALYRHITTVLLHPIVTASLAVVAVLDILDINAHAVDTARAGDQCAVRWLCRTRHRTLRRNHCHNTATDYRF